MVPRFRRAVAAAGAALVRSEVASRSRSATKRISVPYIQLQTRRWIPRGRRVGKIFAKVWKD